MVCLDVSSFEKTAVKVYYVQHFRVTGTLTVRVYMHIKNDRKTLPKVLFEKKVFIFNPKYKMLLRPHLHSKLVQVERRPLCHNQFFFFLKRSDFKTNETQTLALFKQCNKHSSQSIKRGCFCCFLVLLLFCLLVGLFVGFFFLFFCFFGGRASL